MAGVKKLRKIQLGNETTAGTAVGAVDLWRGEGTIEDQRETIFPTEDVGYLPGVGRNYTPKLLAAITMDPTPATFEQLRHICEAGIRSDTASQDGTGSGYIYDYVWPTTSANTLKTYTIEGGDNIEAEEMEYSFVESFTLSGAPGEAVMMSADWLGRQVSTSTFTATTPIPTIEEILFGESVLSIDATGGTIGNTPQTSTFLSFNLDVDTGWQPVFTGDGELYFTFAKSVEPIIYLDVEFEHEGTFATAEKDAWRARTARLIRIKIEGTTFTTAGTSYTNKLLQIDLAGKWEKFDKIGERDGNDVLTGRFKAEYIAADTLFASIKIVVNQSALPA